MFHRDGEWFSEIIDDKLYLKRPDYDESFIERMIWFVSHVSQPPPHTAI